MNRLEKTEDSIDKRGKIEKNRRARDLCRVVMEVGKWFIVLWLLWPLRSASAAPINMIRAVLGVLLFIIFAGKLFYDTIIMGILKQRRMSVKQDILAMIGMIVVLGFVVGLLILFVGFVLIEIFRAS